jgi:hypothetical protein
MPLFCRVHPDVSNESINTVLLIEGALKSLIVAVTLWRYGLKQVAVIGTASAARFGEDTLKEYLDTFNNVEKVVLCPDAGSVRNHNIVSANLNTLKSCENLGYEPLVAWWNQVDKNKDLDLDDYLLPSI